MHEKIFEQSVPSVVSVVYMFLLQANSLILTAHYSMKAWNYLMTFGLSLHSETLETKGKLFFVQEAENENYHYQNLEECRIWRKKLEGIL